MKPRALMLGEFLTAATKHLSAALPTPDRRPRHRPLNFSPTQRRGRSATKAAQSAAPPTAERRAQVQVLRTLGIIGLDQKITQAEMRAYDGVFATPIPLTVLAAIAALVDREIPSTFEEASSPSDPIVATVAT